LTGFQATIYIVRVFDSVLSNCVAYLVFSFALKIVHVFSGDVSY